MRRKSLSLPPEFDGVNAQKPVGPLDFDTMSTVLDTQVCNINMITSYSHWLVLKRVKVMLVSLSCFIINLFRSTQMIKGKFKLINSQNVLIKGLTRIKLMYIVSLACQVMVIEGIMQVSAGASLFIHLCFLNASV